jgi:hypothetical protein
VIVVLSSFVRDRAQALTFFSEHSFIIMKHREPLNLDLLGHPVEAPTRIDVVNGRGQGVQKHSGNEMYRMLVSKNKVRNINGSNDEGS